MTKEQKAILIKAEREYGKLSIVFIQRKFKMNYENAKELLDKYMKVNHEKRI